MGQQALLMILMLTAAYTKSDLWSKVCPKPLSDVGIDQYFGGMVAHTMHSLTVEDIRYFYKKDVTVDNGIPTVNSDLTPNVTRVLANAPASGYDMSFTTIALRHTDQVLSKMSTEYWGITGYSVLEKLVHAHHMAEMWERSRPHYENFVKSPPSPKVCRCLTRIDENGVRAELELLALKIKFPGLLSGEPDLPYGKNAHSTIARGKNSNKEDREYEFRIYIFIKWSKKERSKDIAHQEEYFQKLMNFDFDGEEDDVVDRAMKELQDGEKGTIDALVDEERWKVWKEGLLMSDERIDRQFGMFMYCMLNK